MGRELRWGWSTTPDSLVLHPAGARIGAAQFYVRSPHVTPTIAGASSGTHFDRRRHLAIRQDHHSDCSGADSCVHWRGSALVHYNFGRYKNCVRQLGTSSFLDDRREWRVFVTEQTSDAGGPEHYTHNYDAAHAKEVIRTRTAESHAAFFLPYLRPGMALLDCGCGPGTITVGLAQVVAPGDVVGTDIEKSQVELGRANAKKLALSNISFELSSAYDLPYADDRFDAAFCHGLLTHLNEPLTALKEMHRVMRSGGIVGVRSPDWAGFLIAPADEVIEKAMEVFVRHRQHNGGDPFIGRSLRGLLRSAGFVNTIGSASYETWGTTEATMSIRGAALEAFSGASIAKQAIQMGWADQAQMQKTKAAFARWAEHPDAFFAHTWCEAIGWKV